MANNCRFLVLAQRRVPNLASRVPALSVLRLSEDMEERSGHPALPAETFGDPSRFRGSCCLAAGWTPAGRRGASPGRGAAGSSMAGRRRFFSSPWRPGPSGRSPAWGPRIMGPRAPRGTGAAAPTARTLDEAHGRVEERTCALAPLDGRPNDLAPLPGRRQTLRAGPAER